MLRAAAAHKLLAPNLAVNPDAVVEVTPLVRTESDLQRVGEARDESILEKNKNKKQMGHLVGRSEKHCTDCTNRESGVIIFYSGQQVRMKWKYLFGIRCVEMRRLGGNNMNIHDFR